MTKWEIEAFLAIVQTKSLSKAAEELYLSQSTISNRLSALEKEIGLQLVIRRKGHRTIELTADGERFVPLAYRWESLWHETEEFSVSAPQTTFGIGCNDSLNVFVFSQMLLWLQEQPDSQWNMPLRVTSNKTVENFELLESGKLDIAFVRNPLRNKNMITEPLFAEEYKMIAPVNSAYPSRPLHPRELNPEKGICPDMGSIDYSLWYDIYWPNAAQQHVQINSAATIMYHLREAEQWIVMPVSVAYALEQSHGVRIYELTHAPVPITCYRVMLRSNARHASKALARFDDLLQRYLDTMPYLTRFRGSKAADCLPSGQPASQERGLVDG